MVDDLCTMDSILFRHCYACGATEKKTVAASHDYKEGYCSRCDKRDSRYPFVWIDFKDALFEAYVKQALGLPAEEKVATLDMTKLTEFTIEKRVNDVEELKYATNLKSITIEASNVQNLDVLTKLPITKVSLGCYGGITEIDVSFMKSLKDVKSVQFYDCKLVGGRMEDVVSSPKLTNYKCRISHMKKESTGNIDYLSKATNVESLELWNDFEQDTNLSVLQTLTKLKSLELHDTNYNEDFSQQQYAVLDELTINGVVIECD